MREASLFLFGC